MKTALRRVSTALVILLCVPEIIMGRALLKDSNLEFYVVSIPIGYGALSAYHSLPKALHHAPFALNVFGSDYFSSKAARGDEENGDESSVRRRYPRIEYGLDLSKFLEMIDHESRKPVD